MINLFNKGPRSHKKKLYRKILKEDVKANILLNEKSRFQNKMVTFSRVDSSFFF